MSDSTATPDMPPDLTHEERIAWLRNREAVRSQPTAIMALAGLAPDPWQVRVLASDMAQVLLLCSRQVGKSTVAGALAMRSAILQPGALILLLSPSLGQSGELFRKVLSYFNALKRPLAVTAESALRIEFANGSRIVSLAGVVGKKIGIRPKRLDDWLVVPNLWGAVIGRPGIMKTAAIRQPFKFLHRLEIEAKRRHAQEMREYQEQCMIAEVRKKQKKKAIEEAVKKKKNPLEVAKQFDMDEPVEPAPKRYVVNDSSVEKLGVLLNQNRNGLTAFRDELVGLLRQLDKEGQESARAFYLEAWDGLGTFTYDRIGRGTVYIDSVTLSVMGGIQPGRLLDYLGGALKGGADDDGLLQRFQLMVYPDGAKTWHNVDRWPDTVAKGLAWEVFQKLDALDPVAVGAETGDGDDCVPILHFSSEAQRSFDQWREKLEPRVRSGDEHPALESHLAKYRSLVPSLALLIHLADGPSGPVSEDLLLDLGWLREEVEETGGRPKTLYRLNPLLFTQSASDPGAKSAISPAKPPFGTNGTGLSGQFQAVKDNDVGDDARGEV
jgi:putative DNA primase/helicase